MGTGLNGWTTSGKKPGRQGSMTHLFVMVAERRLRRYTHQSGGVKSMPYSILMAQDSKAVEQASFIPPS